MVGRQMKKISRPLSAKFGEVILFQDDVEKIVNLMNELGRVFIRTDAYHFDSLRELTDFSEESVSTLYIHTADPVAYVDIDEKSARLFVSTDEPEARRAFELIRKILTAREAVHDGLLESPTIIGALSGAALSSVLGIYFVADLDLAQKNAVAVAACLVTFVLLIWDRMTLQRKRFRTSQVHLTRLSPGKTFWRRNADRIFILVIALMMSILIVLIIRIVISKYLA